MAHLLKRFFYFLLGLIIVNIAVVCVGGLFFPKNVSTFFMHYKRGGNSYLRFNEAKKVKDVDVLFIGTSQCFRGFDVRIFKEAGYETFNLGSSIQTAYQTELLLDRYLDSIRPKRIVFEVNPIIFDSDGVESAADVISNDGVDFAALKMAVKVNNYRIYNTAIFSVFNKLIGNDAVEPEPAGASTNTYVNGGFVQTSLIKNESAARKIPPFTFQFRDGQVSAFENCVDIIRKHKIPYALVQTPVIKNWYKARTNNAKVDSLIAANGNYYNFNKLMELDDLNDFYDENHLTQKGVVKFNRKVIATLRADRFLP